MMSVQNWGIVGHEWVVSALQRMMAAERVPHALLFVGPPGIGKRTLARTLARALECTAELASRPCGACRPCLRIADGNYPDVRFIETERAVAGKQDRRDISIDQIRALQHQMSLKPYEGRWVIGIIADAHTMSDAAANCLLKTLEEPQQRAVLILTAPDTGQLLPTIVSRCQVFPLRSLAPAAAEAALIERFGVAAAHAADLARLSGGRIGWAARAAAGGDVLALRIRRLDALQQVLSASRGQRVSQAATLADEHGKGADGRDAVYETLDLWVSWWRDVLFVQEGRREHIVNADRRQELAEAAQLYAPAHATHSLAALIAARENLERNANARLAIEALLLSLPHRAPADTRTQTERQRANR